MSGVAGVLDIVMRPRREVPVSPLATQKKLENVETSILASLSERHCITKAGTTFVDLTSKERKQSYKEVVDHVVDCTTTSLTAFEAVMRVALSYNIVVADCDRGNIKTIVNLHLVAVKGFKNLFASIPSEAHAIANEGVVHVGKKRRCNVIARHDVELRHNADDDKRNFRHASCSDH
jgi:hypothetical protein